MAGISNPPLAPKALDGPSAQIRKTIEIAKRILFARAEDTAEIQEIQAAIDGNWGYSPDLYERLEACLAVNGMPRDDVIKTSQEVKACHRFKDDLAKYAIQMGIPVSIPFGTILVGPWPRDASDYGIEDRKAALVEIQKGIDEAEEVLEKLYREAARCGFDAIELGRRTRWGSLLGSDEEATSTSELPLHQASPGASPADGPGKKGMFWFNGKSLDFSRATLRFQLIKALWDDERHQPREPQELECVLEAVYPDAENPPDEKGIIREERTWRGVSSKCGVGRTLGRDSRRPGVAAF